MWNECEMSGMTGDGGKGRSGGVGGQLVERWVEEWQSLRQGRLLPAHPPCVEGEHRRCWHLLNGHMLDVLMIMCVLCPS